MVIQKANEEEQGQTTSASASVAFSVTGAELTTRDVCVFSALSGQTFDKDWDSAADAIYDEQEEG